MNGRSLKLIELLKPRIVAAIEVNSKRQKVTRVIRQPEMLEFDKLDRRQKRARRGRG